MSKDVKEVKELKRVKIFFNELEHYQEINRAHEIAAVFKAAKLELERIIEQPITDFAAFRNDVLGYSIKAISERYPAAFNLNLGLQKTIDMLSIDLRKLEQYDAVLRSSPHKINVCSKTGEASADEDQEPFCFYAQSPAELERLKFATELADILERASALTPYVRKANVTNGLVHLVYHDVQTDTLKPNHNYVMQGLPK